MEDKYDDKIITNTLIPASRDNFRVFFLLQDVVQKLGNLYEPRLVQM